MDRHAKIYVAGHLGLVGSAIVRELRRKGYDNLLFRTHSELDLTIQSATMEFFRREKPDCVFLVAAYVGGIQKNILNPVESLMRNLQIELNVLQAAFECGVDKLLVVGSSCIYPANTQSPIQEEALLTGVLETANEGYALAKIAAVKACEYYKRQYNCSFFALTPCNLYGMEDNFNEQESHIIPGLIARFHKAKITQQNEVVIWGSGNARRELLFSEDFAKAALFSMENDIPYSYMNIGSGIDYSVAEIARMIQEIVGYTGKLVFDSNRPEGTASRLMDSTKAEMLGWKPSVSLREGLEETYLWYETHIAERKYIKEMDGMNLKSKKCKRGGGGVTNHRYFLYFPAIQEAQHE